MSNTGFLQHTERETDDGKAGNSLQKDGDSSLISYMMWLSGVWATAGGKELVAVREDGEDCATRAVSNGRGGEKNICDTGKRLWERWALLVLSGVDCCIEC
jgi:hypothetical protein